MRLAILMSASGVTAGTHVLEVQGLTADGQSFTSPAVHILRR